MERSKRIRRSRSKRTSKQEQTTLIIIIIVFHVVGFFGFLIPDLTPFFLMIIPWYLLLMLVVIVISHKPLNARFALFALIVFASTFLAEWIGVHTHLLFGNYGYGPVLGIKLGGVPLIIGVNWFLLIYSTSVSLQRTGFRNIFKRLIMGGLLLVLLDYFIEQSAIKYDFWHWTGGSVPFENYVCWFLISVVLLFVFDRFKFKKQCTVGPALLIAQFLFFMLLRVI